MPDRLDNSAAFDDEQGTRIASPDTTGAGAEATAGTNGEPTSSSHAHESGYGGKAGKPKESNGIKDFPKSRR